jgi:hypothetical protein
MYRTDNLLLMSSPLPTILICMTYVYLVKVWGPNYMKNREPMNIQKFLVGYNFFQVLLSLYIFVQVPIQPSTIFSHFTHICKIFSQICMCIFYKFV